MPTRSEGPARSARAGETELTEQALARSVLYAAVAAGLGRPHPGALERLLTPGGERTMVLAAEALDGSVSALRAAAAALARAARPLGELRLRYDALFGHTARGPVCAFETEYGAEAPFRQPQELAHIAGYYRAFGLRLGPEGGRADHIACECEFMALLAGREACLGEPGAGREEDAGERAEQVETTRRATRDFLRNHLGRFGLAFGARLSREDGDGFFGGVAGLLVALLHGDARRFDVTLGPPALELRPPAEDPAPMACGSCPELLGMDRERV